MKIRNLIIFLIIIGAICGIAYAYFSYEKPIQEAASAYSQITILASESGNSKNIVTGFEIIGKDYVYDITGITSQIGAISESLPTGHSFEIKNINMNNQKYYETSQYFTTQNTTEPHRIQFNLIHPGKFSLIKENYLDGSSNNLNLKINLKGYLKYPIVCMTYSTYIVSTNLNNSDFVKILPSGNYQNYFNCYQSTKLYHNQNISLSINYQYWKSLHYGDYINISVIDSEFNNINETTTYNAVL